MVMKSKEYTERQFLAHKKKADEIHRAVKDKRLKSPRIDPDMLKNYANEIHR